MCVCFSFSFHLNVRNDYPYNTKDTHKNENSQGKPEMRTKLKSISYIHGQIYRGK